MNTKRSLSYALRLLYVTTFAGVIVLFAHALEPSRTASAAGTYTVNTTSDTHCTGFISQGAPTCGGPTDGGGHISLRSALEAASAFAGNTTISLPAGTYNLSLGDLVAGTATNTSITIHGASAASTTIQQSQAKRLAIVVNYNLSANVVFQLDNVTISGGNEDETDPDGFGGNGGAILAGGSSTATGNAVTITNVVFSGNYCSPAANAGCTGGAINMTGGGNLTVAHCTFSGNTASKNRGFGAGGAIYFDNGGQPGNVSITNSTFTNNTANGSATTGGQGGAVHLAGGAGTTHAVNTNTFTGNTANGTAGAGANGGAMTAISGFLTANYNRITGNTAAAASGIYVANNANTWGDERYGWWGCNGGANAAGCDTTFPTTSSTMPLSNGQIAFNPWIVLTNTPSPAAIQVNQTTTLTAGFLQDSNGGSLTTSQVSRLLGLPVTWGNAQKGVLSSQQATIQSAGTATATFTATFTGAGSANATVDNATATAAITIDKATATLYLPLIER